MLDLQFKSWESKERIGEGKIVTRVNIAPKIQLKPASAKEKRKEVEERPIQAEKVKIEPDEKANKIFFPCLLFHDFFFIQVLISF